MIGYEHDSDHPGYRDAGDAPPRQGAPGKKSLTQALPAVQRRDGERADGTLAGAIGGALDLFANKSRREQLATLRDADPAEQSRMLDQVPDSRRVWLVRSLRPGEQGRLLAAMDAVRRRAAIETLGNPAVASALNESSVPAAAAARIVLAAPAEMRMDLVLSLAYAKRYEPLSHMRSWQLGQILDAAADESLRMLVAPMPVDVLAPLFADMIPRRQARVQALLPRETETALALHPASIESGGPVQRKRSGSEVGEYLMTLFHPDAPNRPFPVQRRDEGPATSDDVQAQAAEGVRDAGDPLPYLDRIQQSFGRHDVTGARSATGGSAAAASKAIGAAAYTTGNKVAFAEAPDLHTAAHEAAHIVQQQQGVQLAGGVGQAGDAYEQHADAVADAVVRGESAEKLLTESPGQGSAVQVPVQRKKQPYADHILSGVDIPAEREKRVPPAEITGELHSTLISAIATGHASPRWEHTQGRSKRRLNLELSSDRASHVRARFQAMLDVALAENSVRANIELAEDTIDHDDVAIHETARGDEETLREAGGDENANDRDFRRVDLRVTITYNYEGEAGYHTTEPRHYPAHCDPHITDEWQIKPSIFGSAGGVGAAGGGFMFTLRNYRTKQTHEFAVVAGGVGGGLSTPGMDPSGGSWVYFTTDEPVTFEDFDGTYARVDAASVGIGVAGYSYTSIRFDMLGTREIKFYGFSMGNIGADAASLHGVVSAINSPPGAICHPSRTEDEPVLELQPFAYQVPRDHRHTVYFKTGDATLTEEEAARLQLFAESVAYNAHAAP